MAEAPGCTDTAHGFAAGSRQAYVDHEVLVRVMEEAHCHASFAIVLAEAAAEFTRSLRIVANALQGSDSCCHSANLIYTVVDVVDAAVKTRYLFAANCCFGVDAADCGRVVLVLVATSEFFVKLVNLAKVGQVDALIRIRFGTDGNIAAVDACCVACISAVRIGQASAALLQLAASVGISNFVGKQASCTV